MNRLENLHFLWLVEFISEPSILPSLNTGRIHCSKTMWSVGKENEAATKGEACNGKLFCSRHTPYPRALLMMHHTI